MMNKTLTIRLDRDAALALDHLKKEFNEKAGSKVIIRAIKEFGLARNEDTRPDIADDIRSLREEVALLRSELRDAGLFREAQPKPDVAEDNEPAQEPVTTQAPVENNATAEKPAKTKGDKQKNTTPDWVAAVEYMRNNRD